MEERHRFDFTWRLICDDCHVKTKYMSRTVLYEGYSHWLYFADGRTYCPECRKKNRPIPGVVNRRDKVKKICDYWKHFTGDFNAKYGPYCRYSGCGEYDGKGCKYKKIIKEKKMQMKRKSKLTLEQKIKRILPRQRESEKAITPGKWYIVFRENKKSSAHMYMDDGMAVCGVPMPKNSETLEIEPGYPVEKKCKDCRWIERHGDS